MATNLNSWELPGLNLRNSPITNTIGNSNYIRTSQNGNSPITTTRLGRMHQPPPTLPRRPDYNIFTNYNTHGSYLNNYGMGGYPSFGSFGNYGYRPMFPSYSYGHNPSRYESYGSSNPELRFIQIAEESSRPAFQAIQSVVHGLNSISMMFDSTFHAIYSSYMSVIGVAENFGKLRSFFGQLFSTLALIRSLKWIYNKLLYLMGISKEDSAMETIWLDSLTRTNLGSDEDFKSRRPQWSILLFLSLIMGGPYFLFKLMSRIFPNPVRELWNPTNSPGSLAVGIYDFNSDNDRELSFCAQQKLMVAPEKYQPLNCSGWLLACDENRKIGFIPKNYIGIIMQSEKTGKAYIDYNGQKIEPPANFLSGDSGKYSKENTRMSSDETENITKDADEKPENNQAE